MSSYVLKRRLELEVDIQGMLDFQTLNSKQLQAVTAPLGPVLVLAGAGSGKTRALAFRIAYLCSKKLIAPENILALTFTNKAAKEMQERVKKILPDQPTAFPYMGTFHSVCARLLRQEISALGYSRGFTIYDTDDQLKVLKEILQDLHVDRRFPPSLFKAYISSAKNILQTPEQMDLGLEADLQNLVREVYGRYQNFLYHQNGVDFDDLLMLTVKIFENFPTVLSKYRKLFKYILVDEYQDTNHAQYVLLYLLAQEHQNIFVVGDDAQSIYGFRGSSIRNILNFEQDFPTAKVIKLEQNYRSTKNILAVAQKVIEINPEQKPKTLWTENEDGPKVTVIKLDDEMAEARFVAKKIVQQAGGEKEEISYEPEEQSFSILDHFLRKSKKGSKLAGNFSLLSQLSKDHANLNDYAILFRTHAQSRALEEVLIESGIPYQIVGGVKFYERKEIKDLLAYLRLTLNFRDLVSLKRAINEPSRGIGEKTYQIIKQLVMKGSLQKETENKDISIEDFISQISSLSLGPKISNSVVSFFKLVDRFVNLPAEETLIALLKLIIKAINFEDWLKDGSEMGETRWENVKELITVTEKFSAFPWKEGLERFLEEVSLLAEVDELNESRDTVTLMTLHSAKGLEFETVFLVGVEEGILPHSRSLFEPSELSEEIRLAYVGLTRAKKNLFVTFASARRAFGNLQFNQPSRILRALPREKITYQGLEPEDLESRYQHHDSFSSEQENEYEDEPGDLPF